MNVCAFKELQPMIATLAEQEGCKLSPNEVGVEWLPAPHRPPSSLPINKQGIYCFFFGPICLKVGKAGPRSSARYTSQHYGPNAPSTLSKAIIKGKNRLLALVSGEARIGLQTNDAKLIGQWLKTYTGRLNVLIPAGAGPRVLSLIEIALQHRFQPIFEGYVRP